MSLPASPEHAEDFDPSLPDVTSAGARAGIASVFAYLKGRARLFADETHARLTLGGKYTLLEKLGEGANGVVFLAIDTSLVRKVAIKVLRRLGDPLARARLHREAQHLAKLNHPHVLQVHEVGEHRGEIYMVMEYIEGAPLDIWIKKIRPKFRALLAVLIDVGHALAAAHAAGIVHRDVKPANILIAIDGRARIGDFGLAWLDGSLESELFNSSSYGGDGGRMHLSTLSQSGAGTPEYMSPEQFRRGDLDPRSDLFSFCVVVWEAVYGARPHAADTIESLRDEVIDGRIVAPARRPAGVHSQLEPILRRGLSPDRAARHAGMPALLSALDRLRQQRSLHRLALAASFGAGLVLVGSRIAVRTCTDTGDLDTLWSPAIAEELKDSLGVSDAGVADALVDHLATFASELRDSRTRLCEHQRDDNIGEAGHARAQACLDEREGSFSAVVSALRATDGRTLAITPGDLSAALGSLARCGDPRYFTAAVEPPTLEQRLALADVRGRRNDGEAALLRGEFPAAAWHFADAVAQARDIGHAPATAEALYDLGRTYLRLRRGSDATAALREAQILADWANDSFIAADASLLLLSAAVASHDLEAASWHEQETLARLHQSKRDHGGSLGEVELARVDRLLRLDRLDEAESALAAAEQHLLADPPEGGLWHYNLPRMRARVAAARGRFQDAATDSADAWAALVESVGSTAHPFYAEELGRYLLDAGDLAAAGPELTRARTLYADAFGPDSVHVVSVDVALARLADLQGRSDEVARIAARADAILRRHPDEPMTLDERVAVAGYVGRESIGAGDCAAALAAFDRGVAALTAVDVPAQAVNFALLAASGADLRVNVPELRDVPRAREQIAAALDRWPPGRRVEDPARAVFLLRVAADVALAAGDIEAARRHAEAGLEWLPRAPDPATQARLKYALARALGRDTPRSQELATSARDLFTSLDRPKDAEEIQTWIEQRS